MRSIFFSLEDDHREKLAAWDAAFRPFWDDEAKDAWLDRMPVAPEHPTTLVTLSKRIRAHRNVPATDSLPRSKQDVRNAPIFDEQFAAKESRVVAPAPRPRVSPGPLSPGFVKAIGVEVRRDRHADGFTEWTRAEVEYERCAVPEAIEMNNLLGDLERDFAALDARLLSHRAAAAERERYATRYFSVAA